MSGLGEKQRHRTDVVVNRAVTRQIRLNGSSPPTSERIENDPLTFRKITIQKKRGKFGFKRGAITHTVMDGMRLSLARSPEFSDLNFSFFFLSAIDIRKTSYEKIFGLPAVFPLKKKRTVWKRFPLKYRNKQKEKNSDSIPHKAT